MTVPPPGTPAWYEGLAKILDCEVEELMFVQSWRLIGMNHKRTYVVDR